MGIFNQCWKKDIFDQIADFDIERKKSYQQLPKKIVFNCKVSKNVTLSMEYHSIWNRNKFKG